MKKLFNVVLVAVLIVLASCMAACGNGADKDDGGEKGNKGVQVATITKIVITAPTEVEAGKNVQIAVKLTFSDGKTVNNASFLSYEDLTVVITSGNQYCQVADDNISVSDTAPDKLSVSFYVKNKTVKSNTLQLSVSNRKAVLEAQLQEYEKQKQELETEIQSLQSQYNTTEAAYNKNKSEYEQLTAQLIRNGCMTSDGFYNHFQDEERSHQRLYEQDAQLWNKLGKISVQLDSKKSDLEKVKENLKNTQEEIKNL